MSWGFKDTCNYKECKNKDNCERYSEQGAYDMKIICADKEFKWMINKDGEVIEFDGSK